MNIKTAFMNTNTIITTMLPQQSLDKSWYGIKHPMVSVALSFFTPEVDDGVTTTITFSDPQHYFRDAGLEQQKEIAAILGRQYANTTDLYSIQVKEDA